MIWKYFYSRGTYNWVDVLDKLTNYCNTTKHNSILMKPANVNHSNSNIVGVALYGLALGELPLPKFRISDTVRVSKYESIFSEGYEADFTEEIFKIVKVFRGDSNMHEIDDYEGEPIIGKFYEYESSAVDKKDNTYRIEKVLKKKKRIGFW